MVASVSASEPKKVTTVRSKGHRWYLGGLASAGAAACTHPLDLLKVHLQTQQEVVQGFVGTTFNVVKRHGFLTLYNGLSASLSRQLSYSTIRFGVYEILRPELAARNGGTIPFYQKILLGAFGGLCGGIVGSPFDVINIRMQNDVKLPPEKRRRYKHVIDGIRRVAVEEGFFKLWTGASLNICRAILMTLSQIAFYEQVKQMLLATGIFKDNPVTHFTSSFVAGMVATAATQPVDVLKTRMMNAQPGEYKSIMQCFLYTAKTGPLGFFKGFVPAFIRLGPHTILTFVFLEQLRILLPK
ncbi:mitochondrial dicarboxylate carrier-like [Halichondria panicea]|uniref:mitochondrial dicarboxylate carrier-like n=1 Tax=Halichondria panicea TaxID=6063 RepID=UPI00312B5775